jgi:UDP-glucose 4-epimerase/UDP-glucuronate 4-epimerase
LVLKEEGDKIMIPKKGASMILLTGGGGFLGLNLARDLVEKGKEVVLLSWVHERHKTEVPSFLAPYWGKEVQEVMGDVLEWPSISGVMAKYPIDSIVHAAGTWPGRAGETSIYHVASVDVVGTLNILEAARLFSLRRVTFISSIGVYFGLPDKAKIDEDINLPALHPDAISTTKKAAEQICSLYANMHKMDVRIIRVGRIYGPGAHWGVNPLERMVTNALKGAPADCLDTYEGNYVCPIHAKDCAKGINIIHLAPDLKHTIYNLADGNCVTHREVADMVKEIFPDADIRLATSKQSDVSFPFDLDMRRIKDEGWKPEYSDLRRGIRAYADYLMHGTY